MIAGGLPPYSNVMRRGQYHVDTMVIEPGVVEELRSLSEDDIAMWLNDPEKKVQLHTAALGRGVSQEPAQGPLPGSQP